MAAKDWNGAANEFGEAAKLDAEQQAVWQGLALALYNRGVTNFNESTKDPRTRRSATPPNRISTIRSTRSARRWRWSNLC